MIISEIDELGISWVVVDDDAWKAATMTDYVGGFPIMTRRP